MDSIQSRAFWFYLLCFLGTALPPLLYFPTLAEEPSQDFIEAEAMKESSENLAPGIPKDRVPDYSIDQFQYVSISNGAKQWKIVAKKAYIYSKEKIVHSKGVDAEIYDSSGTVTHIKGQEGKYLVDGKDIEIFGHVRTQMSDGFNLFSQYLKYLPKEERVEIPSQYFVSGESTQSGEKEEKKQISFQSFGMLYNTKSQEVSLLRNVEMTMLKPDSPQKDAAKEVAGVPEKTIIRSDFCRILRKTKLARFVMDPNQPLERKFVWIEQPTLNTRARRADLRYGDFSSAFQYLSAEEDVLIKELDSKEQKSKKKLRYATAGKAEFDTQQNQIVLTEYPQVYQDKDTVIGDSIILLRDTDTVLVQQSNAYSEGHTE